MKYILSIFLLVLLFSCNQVPLEYRLQYSYTSEERDSLETRISKEVKMIFEGSLVRQSKLDTLIALNDSKEEYYRQKSNKFNQTGNFQDGFPLIEKAVQLDPMNALYFTTWQMLYLYRDYGRALADLDYYDDITTGESYVSGENVHYLKGLAYKQLKMYDQAVEEFDKCLKHEGDNASEYVYVYRGIANLRHECLEEAEADFIKAIEKYENCTMAYVYLGELKLRCGMFEDAMHNLLLAENLLCRGAKKTHPYFEVFDEVHLEQVYDFMSMCGLELEM